MIDNETWWYYCQSRMYNPDWGRFFNGDSYLGNAKNLLSNNAYSYCHSNPINLTDSTGKNPGDLFTSTDDAAEDCINYIGQKSINDNAEYYTVIYRVVKNDNVQYTYDEPKKGGEFSSAAIIIPMLAHNIPFNNNLAATVHTHGKWHGGSGNEGPSDADVNMLGSVCTAYVANPSGNAYKIDTKGNTIQRCFSFYTGIFQGLILRGGGVDLRKPWKSGFPSQPDAFWTGRDPTLFPIRRN